MWSTGKEAASRAENYRAPSWSWASIDRRIYAGTPDPNDSILVKILDAEVTTAHGDPFGRALYCRIRLQGPIRIFPVLDINLEEKLWVFMDLCATRLVDDLESILLHNKIYGLVITRDSEIGSLEGIVLTPSDRAKDEYHQYG